MTTIGQGFFRYISCTYNEVAEKLCPSFPISRKTYDYKGVLKKSLSYSLPTSCTEGSRDKIT